MEHSNAGNTIPLKNFFLPLWSLVVLLLLMLSACAFVDRIDATATPTKMSLEAELAEEERAAALIATARTKKTQVASRVSPYVKVSNGEQTYLAFWFRWNDEYVLLPIDEIGASDFRLVSCRLDSGVEIASGVLISGVAISQNECVLDKHALENAHPIIAISGYIDSGIETEAINSIHLNGEYAENLADVMTFTIENDLLGSGDLTLSLYRTDGPNGNYGDDQDIPSYTLPTEALQVAFEKEHVANFEYVEDVIYELRRRFTWEIPPGYEALRLSAGDENWFVVIFSESDGETETAYIQVKGVGATPKE